MSRGEAKRRFSVEDHLAATSGVECRKDSGVIDETPGAYKDINAVMAAQHDLVEIVQTLKQVVCVEGLTKVIEGRSLCGRPVFWKPRSSGLSAASSCQIGVYQSK